jgi:hypothetical protein
MNGTEEPGGLKKHEATVYISNLSEDVWPFISAISDPVAKRTEIEENSCLSDRDLFSLAGENHVLFITSKPSTPEFLGYFRELTGIQDFEVTSTRVHTGEICRDILADPDVMDTIVRTANSSRRVELISYTTSVQFLNLATELKKRGLTVTTTEAPNEEDAWTVNFYGSKSGIRQLAQQSAAVEPDMVMPTGLIVSGIVDAARVAANKFIEYQGVVIKTNKGHSGAGILIFRPGELPAEYQACQEMILSFLKKDAYWDTFPIVIEDYIDINPNIGGGFPNVEYLIHKNGKIDFLYYCSLRVTREGVFKGVEINDDVIPEKHAAQLIDTGFYIAEQYAREGYRGYFDVDYVAAKNGKLYVTESNVRRTGATHVYHMAKKFFGDDFMHSTYILSNNGYALHDKSLTTFLKMKERLEPILFTRKTREGLIIVSENMLPRQQFMYIIFGPNKKRALEIEAEMDRLLEPTAS